MKRFLIVAAALLMLSCSCREGMESELPRPSATPSERGKESRVAATVTGIISGNDSERVQLKVSRIVDGDTFEGHIVTSGGGRTAAPQSGVGGWWSQQMAVTVIRINGIDAPERGQFFGDVAKAHLHWLVSGKTVVLKLKQRDQYGRWIATAYADGMDVGAEMLKEGLAWHYEQYDNSVVYAQLEAEAKRAGRGLWCDERAVPPWEWRKMSKYERDAYR